MDMQEKEPKSSLTLKSISLFVLTSGFIVNAVYIAALYYYKGLVSQLGFEQSFFPITWSDTPFWAYTASVQIGARYLSDVSDFLNSTLVSLVIVALIYLLCRYWKNHRFNKSPEQIHHTTIRFKRNVIKCKRKAPRLFKIYNPIFKYFFKESHHYSALLLSCYWLIIIGFFPLFMWLWISFPNLSKSTGEMIGQGKIEYFSKYLCGQSSDYWNQCINISLPASKDVITPSRITGRLLLKHGGLLGIYTKSGPVTISMPKNYYNVATPNPCYKKDCLTNSDDSER